MSDTYRAVIPYESMDPLAIGATDDESKKHRDTLEVEIPTANLIADVRPDEPAPVGDATDAARRALAQPVDGPTFADAPRRADERRRRHRQPVPADAVRRSSCPRCSTRSRPPGSATSASAARTGRSSRCPSRTSSRRSAARTSRAWSGTGWSFSQNDPQNPDAYTFVGVSSRGTPVWLLNEVATRRREDHDRPGAGEPLGRRRRRQADPAGRRLRRDDRVEPLRVRDRRRRRTTARTCGPMRSDIDEVATMCGLDCTMNVLLDTHGRVIDVHLRLAPGGTPRGDPPLQRDLRVRLVRARARAGRHRDLRRVRADRPPVLPHRLGLHVGRPRGQGRRHDHLLRARRRASRPRSATSPASR